MIIHFTLMYTYIPYALHNTIIGEKVMIYMPS